MVLQSIAHAYKSIFITQDRLYQKRLDDAIKIKEGESNKYYKISYNYFILLQDERPLRMLPKQPR